MVSQKNALKYYKNRSKVKKTILAHAKKRKNIIYGARAVNKQLKKPLRKQTEDYDIFADNPKKSARILERKLDRQFGFNAFEVRPAKFEGTYKVGNKVTKRNVADFSKKPKKIRTVKRNGIRYAHTSHQLSQIKKSLSDPESKFRHNKDKETRQRIKLNKKLKVRRRGSPAARKIRALLS